MEEVYVSRIDGAVAPDGGPAKAPWKKARWYSGFSLKGEPESGADPDTSFAMVHDNRNLYIAVQAAEPQMDSVLADDKATIQARETGSRQMFDWVTSLDHVAVFIYPESEDESTSCLAFNRNGALASALYSDDDMVYDYDFGTDLSTVVDDRGWSACLALPLSSLRLSPQSDKWKLNVARIRVIKGKSGDAERAISSFVPLPAMAYYSIGPWESRCLGAAVAGNLNLDRFLWQVRPVGSAVVQEKEGEFRVRQKLWLHNPSKQIRRIEVGCAVESERGERTWKARWDFETGEQREEAAEIQLPGPEFGRIRIIVNDAESGEEIHRYTFRPEREELSWKEHWVKQGDGNGGFVCRAAKFQLLPRFRGAEVSAYGLAEMDNGELIFVGSSSMKNEPFIPVTSFSRDGGATWSEYEPVEGCRARPMMSTYLGAGELTFTSEAVNPDDPDIKAWRFYSHDYGRTWPERVPVQPAREGHDFSEEGNFLVDRDADGLATRIAEAGYIGFDGLYMFGPSIPAFRWSNDGGRTWGDAVFPPEWTWEDTFLGRTYVRGVSEGSLVRAANGWIVAALRTDCPARYLDVPGGDNLEGTAISISKDEGKTWSPKQVLFDGGRMHGNLLRLAGGDLLLTAIRRIDMRDGGFASYRRGCDAFISHDNGLTWNLDRMVVLDDFAYMGMSWAVPPSCGHLYSIELSDGSVLTAYSNYNSKRPALINWRP
jgi:hypothetical protein